MGYTAFEKIVVALICVVMVAAIGGIFVGALGHRGERCVHTSPTLVLVSSDPIMFQTYDLCDTWEPKPAEETR